MTSHQVQSQWFHFWLLRLLPLMHIFELSDIMFFIKSIKSPTNSFNISNFISFSNSPRSRGFKLHYNPFNINNQRHFYFVRICHLWNDGCHFTYTNHQEQNKVSLLGSFHLLFWPSGPSQIALSMSLQPVCLQTVFCQLFGTLTVTTIYFSCNFFFLFYLLL